MSRPAHHQADKALLAPGNHASALSPFRIPHSAFRTPHSAPRLPTTLWVIAAVTVAHVLFFWLVEDEHFMPHVDGYSPPPSPPNFGTRTTVTVDPATGESTTETIYVVSTQFASPPPATPPPSQ